MKHAHLFVTCTYPPHLSVTFSFSMVGHVCWEISIFQEPILLLYQALLLFLMRVRKINYIHSWFTSKLMPIFSGFLHNSSLATSNYDFTRSTQAWWQNSIYYQESTSSLDHCASICEISYISNYLCDVFAFDGSTCHIGNKDKLSHTHHVPAGMSILYSDPGKIISEVLAIRCHQIMFHCRSSSRRIESLPDSGGNQHYMVSKVDS